MRYQKTDDKTYLVRIKRGEKILASLKKFSQKEKIEGGFFYGLGAVDEVELAHYDVATKKYSSRKYQKPLEMTNITGSLGVFEKDLIVHAHAAFTDQKMTVIGGHLVEAKVSATAEIYLTKLPRLSKFLDTETGLKLFNLPFSV